LAKVIVFVTIRLLRTLKTNKINPGYYKNNSYSLLMENNNNERKKIYHEFINFAIQGMSENAQFSLAIAVGIFGILVIFVTINPPTDTDIKTHDPFLKNALWEQQQWVWSTGIVLSIAYWALVLFGIQIYISRRLFEGVMGDYLKKMNEEQYYNDIREIAKENKLANLMFKVIWSSNHERKDRYKGMYIVLISYVGIAFFLWLFIGIL
jgi:hypothetical protein